MKYKKLAIEKPDWCEIGVAVRLKKTNDIYYIRGVTEGPSPLLLMDSDKKFVGNVSFDAAEPVPAWEPTPGEYVAAWDDGYSPFMIIGVYEKRVNGAHKIKDQAAWKHVARITGVDCVCSVEELKKRTDWL